MKHSGKRATLLRVLVTWAIAAASLWLFDVTLRDVTVVDVGAAFEAAALIGLLNALAWPLVIRLALPFTVLTLGLGVLVLNGLVVLVASSLDAGFRVDGLFAAIFVAIGITIVNTVVTTVLAIDDDDFYYRNVVKRHAKRARSPIATDLPGIFFLEIDGLAHSVAVRAMRDGNMPTLARWLRSGSHRMMGWETDWSSQTGACQAGLLHGNNEDMPAFRWWEKDRDAQIVTNHPRDAEELERRHSNGRGLLFEDGASRANILSGDAPHSLLTMSTVLDRKRAGRLGQDYFAYFANPYNATRTLVRTVAEVASELRSAAQQRRLDVQPRIERGFGYAVVRAWATVVQLDLQVQTIIADLYAGRPVAYTTFLAYDEVAHHSGIERADALATLRRVDRQLARIEAASKDAPRPYHLVVLSDHGQSQGETFKDRYDQSLEELVREACSVDSVFAPEQGSEALGYMSAAMSETAKGESAAARAVRLAVRGRTVDGEVRLGESEKLERAGEGEELPELSVMASGCLGLISFPREPGRLTLERIEELHPRLVPALCDHSGIGFLLVRSAEHGALAIGAQGVNYLDKDRVEGEDPLAPYGPNAARHVKRTDGFEHCADVMVNSTYWRETEEVAAFEELVGSHGGMGGTQSYPFVAAPREFSAPDDPIVGAEAMHRNFRRWLVDLGHLQYRDRA